MSLRLTCKSIYFGITEVQHGMTNILSFKKSIYSS